MAQRVARRRTWDAGGPDGVLHRALHDRFVQVMTTPLPGLRVAIEASRGEDPLPRPLSLRTGILRAQRAGERHGSTAGREVRVVLPFDA